MDGALAPHHPPAVARPRTLLAWIALQVLAATVVVLVATRFPIEPGIALHWPGLEPQATIVAGLAFWVLLGLVGGLRSRFRTGGGVLTFSMPFIVAGTLLGGPLAGALLGLVAELELREIRTQPWYGTLANHAVSILAAVGSACVGIPVRLLLEGLVPGQQPLAFFVTALVMALTFVVINVLLVLPTLAFRIGLSLEEARHIPDAAFRATSVAEAILAWNLAAAYLMVGWWAPVAIVGLVLVVWEAYDHGEELSHDAMTGLLNRAGFAPRLKAAVDAAQAGRRQSALLFVDLNKFKRINDIYLERTGDEVIVVTARRLLMAVRAMDSVSRLNGAGDEFVLLLDGIDGRDGALHVAERVHRQVCEPIRLRTASAVERVGASVGVALIGLGTTWSAEETQERAEAAMQEAKNRGDPIVLADELDEASAQERRRGAGDRRRESPTSIPVERKGGNDHADGAREPE